MCYEFLPRKEVLKDEIEQRKERVSMSRQISAWISAARGALTARKGKHSEGKAEMPPKVRERLVG